MNVTSAMPDSHNPTASKLTDLSTLGTSQFFNANYAQHPVVVKPTWDYTFKNYIPQNGPCIAKCAESLSQTGTPWKFIRKLMRVKNVSNVTCVPTQVLARGIWNHICWFTLIKNPFNVMLVTKVSGKNNSSKGIKTSTIIQIMCHHNQRRKPMSVPNANVHSGIKETSFAIWLSTILNPLNRKKQ